MEFGRLLHQTGNAFVALAAEAHGPVHRRALAHFVLPVVAGLGKEIGPDVGGAAAIGAMHDDDIGAGKLDALIRASQFPGSFHLVIVPRINSRESLLREIQFAGDARNVVGRHDGAENGGEVQNLELWLAPSCSSVIGPSERRNPPCPPGAGGCRRRNRWTGS